jgi:hypothetical protein
MPNVIRFSPIQAADVAAMVNELRRNKSTVTLSSATPDTYSIEGHGIGAIAVFSGGALTVTVLHKPFFISLAQIQDGIRAALAQG